MLNHALVHLFKKCLAFGLIVYLINKAPEQNGKNRDLSDLLWSLTVNFVTQNETGNHVKMKELVSN